MAQTRRFISVIESDGRLQLRASAKSPAVTRTFPAATERGKGRTFEAFPILLTPPMRAMLCRVLTIAHRCCGPERSTEPGVGTQGVHVCAAAASWHSGCHLGHVHVGCQRKLPAPTSVQREDEGFDPPLPQLARGIRSGGLVLRNLAWSGPGGRSLSPAGSRQARHRPGCPGDLRQRFPGCRPGFSTPLPRGETHACKASTDGGSVAHKAKPTASPGRRRDWSNRSGRFVAPTRKTPPKPPPAPAAPSAPPPACVTRGVPGGRFASPLLRGCNASWQQLDEKDTAACLLRRGQAIDLG